MASGAGLRRGKLVLLEQGRVLLFGLELGFLRLAGAAAGAGACPLKIVSDCGAPWSRSSPLFWSEFLSWPLAGVDVAGLSKSPPPSRSSDPASACPPHMKIAAKAIKTMSIPISSPPRTASPRQDCEDHASEHGRKSRAPCAIKFQLAYNAQAFIFMKSVKNFRSLARFRGRRA